jgi:hypothetical protein
MSSVTLVHPEEQREIPIDQAITKCSLFKNNPSLTSVPYIVRSIVPVVIFREFVSELQGSAVKITDLNFPKLFELCEEFGLADFRAKLLGFRPNPKTDQSQMPGLPATLFSLRSALLYDSFVFVMKGSVIESDIAEAAALSPAVWEQLSVDICARKFVLSDDEIGWDVRSLQSFLSGRDISNDKSQGLQSRLFDKISRARPFLGCSKADVLRNLSDLESADLSVEALDSLLLSESVSVESEDALCGLF